MIPQDLVSKRSDAVHDEDIRSSAQAMMTAETGEGSRWHRRCPTQHVAVGRRGSGSALRPTGSH